jgi:hypothetical protein
MRAPGQKPSAEILKRIRQSSERMHQQSALFVSGGFLPTIGTLDQETEYASRYRASETIEGNYFAKRLGMN